MGHVGLFYGPCRALFGKPEVGHALLGDARAAGRSNIRNVRNVIRNVSNGPVWVCKYMWYSIVWRGTPRNPALLFFLFFDLLRGTPRPAGRGIPSWKELLSVGEIVSRSISWR